MGEIFMDQKNIFKKIYKLRNYKWKIYIDEKYK